MSAISTKLGRELARGLKQLEKDAGNQKFTWNGADYVCVEGVSTEDRILGAGGMELLDELILFVRRDQLPDPGPQSKQKLTFLGEDYWIGLVQAAAGGAFLRLSCRHAT